MSSVFVRIGNAEFSRNRGHAGPFKISACLQGLSFKAQFLRLMLREAKGSYANPGRQVLCSKSKDFDVQSRFEQDTPLQKFDIVSARRT